MCLDQRERERENNVLTSSKYLHLYLLNITTYHCVNTVHFKFNVGTHQSSNIHSCSHVGNLIAFTVATININVIDYYSY